MGQGSVFRRFEEGFRRLASHSRPLMVMTILVCSSKIYVGIRTISVINPLYRLRECTVTALLMTSGHAAQDQHHRLNKTISLLFLPHLIDQLHLDFLDFHQAFPLVGEEMIDFLMQVPDLQLGL